MNSMFDNRAVLYIITKLELGGAQKVCLALRDEAAKAGLPTGLISGAHGQLVEQVKKGEHVYLLDTFTREISYKSLVQEIKAFFQLISCIKKFKKVYPDLIVHTHSTKAGILGRWAALCAGVKNRVHTAHGFGFNRYQPTVKWLLMWVTEWLTCLITTRYVCVSQNDQGEGARLLPWFSKKNVLIRAAVALHLNKSSELLITKEENTFIIGTISCFKPQKNLLDLLNAFKLTCDLIATKTALRPVLHVIGDGVMREELEAWIIKHNMSSKIKLLGWIQDVTPWLQQWDLFAMSSLWEGLPCALVEARLSKLPVVAYRIDGIPEVIFDGNNGFLVPAGDWRLLADRMAQLIVNRACYQSMKSYQDDLVDFSYQAMFKKHEALYNSLWANKNS